MNLSKMFSLLNRHNVICFNKKNELSRHWIYQNCNSIERNKFVRELLSCLDVQSVRYDGSCLKKKCNIDRCVNPDCYEVCFRKKDSISNSFSYEDMLDLAEMIDLEKICQIGEKKYLEIFNNEQPDFLKITMKDLKKTIEFVKMKEKEI